MYSLVIVDVQPGMGGLGNVPGNRDKLFPEINKLVKKAIVDDAHVVLVEWLGCGSTYPEITRLLLSYDKWTTVLKRKFSGAPNVVAKVKQYGLPQGHIKVCGVYREICVQKTARGLIRLLPGTKVEIIEQACLPSKAKPQMPF